MTNKLTTSEAAEFGKCERTIKNTKGAFVACGKALEAIRDKKLYRAKHATFDEYCQKVWGWSRQRAHQLIQSSETVRSLPAEMSTMVDKISERGARELTKVAKSSRVRVLKGVADSGEVTAERISKQSRNGAPEIVRDDTGYIVPLGTQEFWNRKDEAKRILRLISDARCAVKGLSAEDQMWSEVNLNGAIADLNNAYNNFATAVPYAVCTSCQGVQPKKCTLCKGRGVISKFRYDNLVPDELKTIRVAPKD